MKRGLIGRFLFTAIIFTFLLSGILAVDEGKCDVVARTSCDNNDPASAGFEGYVVMGLSALTNAHGETTGTYPYVLCCRFGDGVQPEECTTTNTIINLSSSTNAHAEIPSKKNYHVGVCYEDLQCIRTTSECGSGTAVNYPKGILSLSEDTNAHIGPYNGVGSYTKKICCSSVLATQFTCAISTAEDAVTWSPSAQKGDLISELTVKGSGGECGGVVLTIDVLEKDEPAFQPIEYDEVVLKKPFPDGMPFNESGTFVLPWITEWKVDDDGSQDLEYVFNISIWEKPEIGVLSDELKVTERNEEETAGMTSCEDYDSELLCKSDTEGFRYDSGMDDIDCSDKNHFECACVWDETKTPKCQFGYFVITEETCGKPIRGEGCEYGCTLCHNTEGNYCHAGSSCPTNENPITNKNGSCDFGIDGCVSTEDCHDGNKDTCADGTYCVNKKCGNVAGPPMITLGICKITQTELEECDAETGIRKIKVEAEWTGSPTDPRKADCDAKDKPSVDIKCPTQAQLPFFDYIGIITTVLAIAGIYITIMFRKKFRKKK